MQSMNYGELPTRQQFRRQWSRLVGPSYETMRIELKGSDRRCALDYSPTFADRQSWEEIWFDEHDTWEILRELNDGAWAAEEHNCAADLASSILYVLDFEWI